MTRNRRIKRWRFTARESALSEYHRKMYHYNYRTKRCAHWKLKRPKLVGIIGHFYKFPSWSKSLWVTTESRMK